MFDDQGRPQGYGQYSPFTDQPQAPGAQADPNAIPGAGAGTPSHPVDPTLNGWRSGGMGGRQLGQPHLPMAPQLPGAAPTPLQNAIQPSSQATGGVGAPSGGAPATGDLTDPTQWMSLVGNHQNLSGFVHNALGPKGSDELANYYEGKIQGQPGANPTEQAGSAKYWEDKMHNDPNITGRPAQSAPRRMNPVMSAIAPGLQNPASDPSLSQTGSSNPLLAAIRQSLGQKKVSSYGV